jgi:tetratricopeptide (TPR) repeat protein
LVVDWGLAKPLRSASSDAENTWNNERLPPVGDDGQATYPGEIVGTPAYMSPEQAQGRVKEIGPASDVYGLGAILFAMLTGQTPVRGSAVEMVRDAAEGRIPHPGKDQRHVPRALAAICLKAMALQPQDRYASALDLAADIERWLADEPAHAYAEPWSDKAFRWVRKHKLPVAVAAALLLVTTVALAVGNVIVRKERDIAQAERTKAVAANERAQTNAAATRGVVEQFLIQVGDDRWSQIPGFEEVRLEMANLAADRYRRLLVGQQNEPALLADAGTAFRRCANLYRMVGRFEPASDHYNEAMQCLDQASARVPQSSEYDGQLCQLLCDRAELVLRLTGPKAAEVSMREALAVGNRLRGRQPDSTGARLVEARAQLNLAEILSEQGRMVEAVRLARAAANTFQQAAEANPSAPGRKLMELLSGVVLAETLYGAGEMAEAAAALDRNIEKANKYVEAEPLNTNLRLWLAWSRFQKALGETSAAPSSEDPRLQMNQAVKSLEELVSEFPKTISLRRKLAEALTAQARAALKGADYQSAAADASRAIELLAQLDRDEGSPANLQSLLGAACAVAGETEVSRGQAEAARRKLTEALRYLEHASAFNPDKQRISDEINRIRELLASLGC